MDIALLSSKTNPPEPLKKSRLQSLSKVSLSSSCLILGAHLSDDDHLRLAVRLMPVLIDSSDCTLELLCEGREESASFLECLCSSVLLICLLIRGREVKVHNARKASSIWHFIFSSLTSHHVTGKPVRLVHSLCVKISFASSMSVDPAALPPSFFPSDSSGSKDRGMCFGEAERLFFCESAVLVHLLSFARIA